MSVAGSEIQPLTPLSGGVTKKSKYAYLFEWNEYYTPKALNTILNKGLRAKVAKSPFSIEGRQYDYGSIMIPVQNQKLNPSELFEFLQKTANKSNLEVIGVETGLAKGIDLGSNDFDPIKKQKIAIVVGRGIRSYGAGEIWHMFDTRYDIKLTKIDIDYFSGVDLSEYTDIIIPSSSTMDDTHVNKLKGWVKARGALIGYRNTAEWFGKKDLIKLNFKKDTLVAKGISFEEKSRFKGAQVTGGAIFEARIDRSHPINYGYKNSTLSLFRNSNVYIEPDKDSYNNPIQYTDNPLLSGYISEENLELLKNSVAFKVEHSGKGRVIVFTDNTNFRAFWYGTNKLLMNAIFFGQLM